MRIMKGCGNTAGICGAIFQESKTLGHAHPAAVWCVAQDAEPTASPSSQR